MDFIGIPQKRDYINLQPYIEENKHSKISLLHLDMDVYEPTKFALEILKDRISKNGMIVVDDYGKEYGATKAIDEFVAQHNMSICTSNFYQQPSFIKY